MLATAGLTALHPRRTQSWATGERTRFVCTWNAPDMKFDYQATLGITLWAGVAYSVVNLAVELAQAIIDPRTVRR